MSAMNTNVPMNDRTQFLPDPQAAAFRMQDADPVEYLMLADAEAEELAELWLGDPGNQGA